MTGITLTLSSVRSEGICKPLASLRAYLRTSAGYASVVVPTVTCLARPLHHRHL
jgi:hypothetical protein